MKLSRSVAAGLAAAALAVGGHAVSQACFVQSPQPVQVWADHIQVDIRNQVAVKRYECVFLNPNANAVVGGMCYMEVEPGAQVDKMSLKIGDKVVNGEILDRGKANQVFTDIVRQGGSPALLEYYGNKLIRTQIPSIPPRGTVTVYLQYTTLLQKRDGLVRISMLNTNPKTKLEALKRASVTVTINTDESVRSVYSPTHPVSIDEQSEHGIKVTWSQDDYLPKTPFVLYYATSDKAKIGADVLAYRDAGDRGYFMTMISPTLGSQGKAALNDGDIQPKDIVFCVDTSYSMTDNGKMDQAKNALRSCIGKLRPADRFNIVDFSTEARRFKNQLVVADATHRQQALNYIDDMEATGGTAIHEALESALDQLKDPARLKMILFMTDGLPTIGEREPDRLLQSIAGKNRQDVRLFVFGAGYDVNTRMLDVLASDNRGDSDYILPEEDIAGRIGKFFDKIGSPVMTDIEVAIDGVKDADLYPRRIPDLFRGDQVVIYGRYEIEGTRELTLRGMLNGERVSMTFPVEFPSVADRHDFVPRLWAGQKVAELLSTLRRDGNNDELIAEVTQLAKRFGIVTPYTAYLVTEDVIQGGGGAPAEQLAAKARGQLRDRLAENASADAVPAGSAPATAEAKREAANAALEFAATRRLLRGGRAEGLDGDRDADRSDREVAMKTLRTIGALTFYQSGGVWYDSRWDAGAGIKPEPIELRSDAYFALLEQHEGIAKYLALIHVVLKVGDRWVQITDPAAK